MLCRQSVEPGIGSAAHIPGDESGVREKYWGNDGDRFWGRNH